MLAIVAPMPIELAGIRRAIRDASDRNIAFSVSGVGKAHTQRSLQNIARNRPEGIILVGFCGGADPELAPGDVHVASTFRHPDSGGCMPADDALTSTLTLAAERVGIRSVSGASATVDTIAGSAAKTGLYESLGSATVNMEDYWAACAAQTAGVPFASLRAVLDCSSVELPRYLAMNTGGVGQTLAGVVAHPSRLPAMVRLARLARTARNSLILCLVAAIDCLAPRTFASPAVRP